MADGIPAKAIAFPGAKLLGDFSHLSKLPGDHLRVALDDKAPEYEKPSFEAMFTPPIPPSDGPVALPYNK